MITRLKYLLFAVLLLAGPVLADSYKVHEPQFFESLNDVPLMPGLYELTEESMVFDKPGGRIAESRAASDSVAVAEIRAFYERTLPQMGWARTGSGAYVREEETLTMVLETRDGFNIVKFMVSPREGGTP